jgi:hypothetical protein
MKKYILTLLIIPILIIGCRKTPDAQFSLNQYEYSAGEAIVYDNLSVNYESCQWEIINNNNDTTQTFIEINPNIVTSILSEDGVYRLKLTAFSKKQKKETVSEKTFLMKSTKYKLTINGNGAGPGVQKDFDIYVDNQFVGKSMFNGQFQIRIPEGLRIVKLVAPNDTFEELRNFTSSVSITF